MSGLDCPKQMVFGPCGGVRDDGRCELADHPCTFLDGVPIAWTSAGLSGTDRRVVAQGASGPRSSLLAAAATRPVVLTDLTVEPFAPRSVRRITELLAGSCDALLVGEHSNRPDLPPTQMATAVRAAGGVPWITLTCRDRNRVVLESELAGLAAGGDADGVLTVTGDGRAQGVRPGVTQVFDLDGPRLASLAADAGLPVAVPESPEAPPTDVRPLRLRVKQDAGAGLAVLNHVSSREKVAAFTAAARAAGVTMPLVAGVAVFTDERSARVLQNFPGLHLRADAVDAVLAADDPLRAGIDAALAEALALLAIPGVVGVNLSGLASDRGVEAAAEVKAEIGRRLRAAIG
jgi:5,10-methylenetetrahydrofolate reductase